MHNGPVNINCKLQMFKNEGNHVWTRILYNLYFNMKIKDSCTITLQNLEVLGNKTYKIPEFTIKNFVIVYLNEQEDWREQRLDIELTKYRDGLTDFPYLNTVFEQTSYIDAELLSLEIGEANLLADMTNWTIQRDQHLHNTLEKIFELEDYLS